MVLGHTRALLGLTRMPPVTATASSSVLCGPTSLSADTSLISSRSAHRELIVGMLKLRDELSFISKVCTRKRLGGEEMMIRACEPNKS